MTTNVEETEQTKNIDTITLEKGAHESPEHGMCAMEGRV